MRRRRLLALAVLAVAIAAFFAAGGPRYLSLEYLKTQQAGMEAWARAQPVRSALAFFGLYLALTALSLPGATLLTLIGGAVFGLFEATVLVSFASSLGAAAAFLASRFLLRDWVKRRFERQLRAMDAGVRREGALYLFALRLTPVVPFFVINLVMGLTAMRVWRFYWVSQIGMLPATALYVNAGTRLGAIASPRDILSPALLAALVLLGLFPLAARRSLDAYRRGKVYARWKKPSKFDRNLVVVGAGAAGLVASYLAAATRAKVTLVEKDRMGGDCLYTGCVPSKALIRSARLLAEMKRAPDFGLKAGSPGVDFAAVMERVQRVVRAVEPHDSVARYTALGVECLAGEARLVSPWEVEVRSPDGTARRLTTRAIVIAAGARPLVPAIPGLAESGCLTSETVWQLREWPGRMVVLGGGPVGCELAQAFARLGAEVTLVEMRPRLLPSEDADVSALLQARFAEEGIKVLTGHRAKRVAIEHGAKSLIAEHDGNELAIGFDQLLCAAGRIARTGGYGLEELGIGVRPDGTIETNDRLQTAYPNIYACGDVAGPFQFTHVASHQASTAAVNALFGPLRRLRADYSVIPWATFTDPEVARVGLSEAEASSRGVAFETTVFPLEELDRALAEGEPCGRVKVLTARGKDRILGASIVGSRAADLITEFVTAMRHRLGLEDILSTIHIYPTFAEANKYAAGAWKRAHAPELLLRQLERYHAWRRR